MKVHLKDGIEPAFFALLNALYAPMLSSRHLKDRFRFTIYAEECALPLGIISLNKGKNSFMQFAVIPDVRGKGIARAALDEVIHIAKCDRIGWACKRINYPSLRILDGLEGGIFENSAKRPNGAAYEGFFRYNGAVPDRMRETLKRVLPLCEEPYQQWLSRVYSRRNRERLALREYLMGQLNVTDAHFHVHSSALDGSSDSFTSKFGRAITPAQVVEQMARSNVKRTIIFGVPSVALDLHQVNGYVLQCAALYPEKLVPFAILHDNADVDGLVAAGFRGFKEHVYGLRIQKDSLGRECRAASGRKERYRRIAARGLPLIGHFGPNVIDRVKDILASAPGLSLVVAHMGSCCNGPVTWNEVAPVLRELAPCKSVFFDTSNVKDPAIIEKGIELVGAHKLLWGSDWPIETPDVSIRRLLAGSALSLLDCEKMCAANVQSLLQP